MKPYLLALAIFLISGLMLGFVGVLGALALWLLKRGVGLRS